MNKERDRGSVIALVPAAFLVLVVLSALAVDSAAAYLGQQQLHDALAAAANDAVTAALSPASFYDRGELTLDPAQVGAVVCRSVAAQSLSGLHGIRLGIAISGQSLRVTGEADVDEVFGRAVPGFGRRSVRATADARLAAGPVPVAPPSFDPPTPLSC